MKVKTSKGFTLAELLIVMAIIVVLAAVAIPTFGRQLETSRETTDMELVRNAYTEALSLAILDAADGSLDGNRGTATTNGTSFDVPNKIKASGTKDTALTYTIALENATTQADTTFSYVNNKIANVQVAHVANYPAFATFTFALESTTGNVTLSAVTTAVALPTTAVA